MLQVGAVKSGLADMSLNLILSEDREAVVDFSVPYIGHTIASLVYINCTYQFLCLISTVVYIYSILDSFSKRCCVKLFEKFKKLPYEKSYLNRQDKVTRN